MRSPAHRSCETRALWKLSFLLGLALLPATACKLVKKTVEFPGKVLRVSDRGERVTVTYVQTAVMRFADSFNRQIVQATSEFSETGGTPECRIQALNWRVSQMTSALTIASGPNPTANLLDMYVLVTLGRMVHEEHWMPEVWGEADRPMLEAYQKLEEEITEIAEKALSQKQLAEVRETIQEWRENNPGPAFTAFVRLPTFRKLHDSRDKKSDVFQELANLLSLDPFEGLEPATREAAELRVLGERTIFYAQRAPLVFQAQAELLGLKMAQMPEVKKTAEGADRLSRAVEKIAETADELPESIANAQGTLEAGKEMSVALNEAIGSFDALMVRFQEWPREDEGEGQGRPFDVTEYGEAAAKVGEAAKELDALVSNVEAKLPATKVVLDEVVEKSNRVVDRALIRFLIVGLVLIAAGAAASLAVRRMSARSITPSARVRVASRRPSYGPSFTRRDDRR